MATERIRTIKPAGQGGDYSSLSAWEAGEQADLVALDEYRIGEIQGDWSSGPDTTAVTISGWTTDATHYIEVRTDSVNRALLPYVSGRYRIVVGNASAIEVGVPYVKIKGIRTEANWYTFDSFSAATGVVIENCVGKGAAIRVRGTDFRFVNTVVYGTTRGFHMRSAGKLYNCTAYSCSTEGFFKDGYVAVQLVNCVAQNCTDGYSYTEDAWSASSTNNCSDITSDAPGTNPVTGTVKFIDAANGDFTLSPYDTVAQFAGANLYADATYPVTTDIAGNSRGGASASFDIGASHATTSIRRIMESGGDYTSLAAWESAQQRDLVANNKIAVGEIGGTWSSPDTTGVSIDGWTTDALRYIEIRAIGNAKHLGKWDITKYILQVSNSSALIIREPHCKIFNIQIYVDAVSASDQDCILIYTLPASTDPLVLVDRAILKGITTGNNWHCGVQTWSNSSTNIVISNSVAFNFNGAGAANGGFSAATAGDMTTYNCTAYNCLHSFYGVSSPILAKNCLSQNCSNGFNGSFNASSTNNCSDLSSDAPGTNSITATVTFVDAANSDFRLAISNPSIKGKGVNLSNDAIYSFNYDIEGEIRWDVWDIGAHQVTKRAKITNLQKVTRAQKVSWSR